MSASLASLIRRAGKAGLISPVTEYDDRLWVWFYQLRGADNRRIDSWTIAESRVREWFSEGGGARSPNDHNFYSQKEVLGAADLAVQMHKIKEAQLIRWPSDQSDVETNNPYVTVFRPSPSATIHAVHTWNG